jgi:hypothetical protein
MLIIEGTNQCIKVNSDMITTCGESTIELVIYDRPLPMVLNGEGGVIARIIVNDFDLGCLTRTLNYIQEERTHNASS